MNIPHVIYISVRFQSYIIFSSTLTLHIIVWPLNDLWKVQLKTSVQFVWFSNSSEILKWLNNRDVSLYHCAGLKKIADKVIFICALLSALTQFLWSGGPQSCLESTFYVFWISNGRVWKDTYVKEDMFMYVCLLTYMWIFCSIVMCHVWVYKDLDFSQNNTFPAAFFNLLCPFLMFTLCSVFQATNITLFFLLSKLLPICAAF